MIVSLLNKKQYLLLFLFLLKKYKKQAVLELKNRMEKKYVLKIAQTIDGLGWLQNTTFISFAGENLVELRKIYPAADAQYLLEDVSEADFQFMVKNRLDADLYWMCVTKELVERIHNEGLKVNCWTVDDEEAARRMMDYGVDFITSNILE